MRRKKTSVLALASDNKYVKLRFCSITHLQTSNALLASPLIDPTFIATNFIASASSTSFTTVPSRVSPLDGDDGSLDLALALDGDKREVDGKLKLRL